MIDEALYLRPRAANHVPLTPMSFLYRTADLYPDRMAIIDEERRFTWLEVRRRCEALAAGLIRLGVKPGDVVSVLAPNTAEMVEAHFAVAMAGAVLNTINIRLDAETVAYILDHAETRVLMVDRQCLPLAEAALERVTGAIPTFIDLGGAGDGPAGCVRHADLVQSEAAGFSPLLPADEWRTLCLNYTSGTSGRPKGVLYHHRGAYLMTLGTIAGWELSGHPVYLYTVPMFHCNGWGHAWTMTALAATIVCCRQISAKAIYGAIETFGVTHFGGAPVVLGMLVEAAEAEPCTLPHAVRVMTAGAPPPAAILEKVEALGFDVMQVYGLTETYGHVVQSIWDQAWDGLDFTRRAMIKARQGVRFPTTESAEIWDAQSGARLPQDATAMGEIVLRGNTIMKGYHKDEAATEAAFAGGVFHTGDVAVQHPDGFLEIKDRIKDIIISGGENISSIEVESVLYRHPAVSAAAVVAKHDVKWGETPCAFVEFKPGATATADELNQFSRQRLPGFKVPKHYIFETLPKTSTGKIEKYKLRERAKAFP
ncbi:MAG: acyl-CoA synthetase [Mesorhizobium sp.]|uniref:AMP-binding protein n=1 Tax=Mesorhizobium sp. TaxID=1871066 RepID=UPI001222E5E3|nr:AMP-binding protein [Mesorhizobium sp.]TIO78826.1 MAG: acyl-CoA synthetase [Mesorhizobium sp.]TIO87519.1 MAG: acyl-CoA synthetase [Mesorhizobium sp.]